MQDKLIIRGQKIQTALPGAHPLPNRESSLSLLIHPFERGCQWVQYSIIWQTPSRELKFESESFLLCLSPVNELLELKKQLKAFLTEDKAKIFQYEPTEPCFELMLEKDEQQGIKFFFWLDNGNADYEYYTWDALGIRLYTDPQEIEAFIQQIDQISF